MKPKRVMWKIIIGLVLVLTCVANTPLYLSGSNEANAALTTNFLVMIGGFYLIYKGFYPHD
ncbi:MAG TPA: hypothetical protein PKY59_03850 [Pyrinomonadaceae bacterium]|nr:hypothetical protein [Pyrinomonadaceae bacterium]